MSTSTRRFSLKRVAWWAGAACALALAGCQAVAPATPARAGGPWSERQVEVLREYGFEQTDEGWELQMTGKLLFDLDSDRIDAGHRATVDRMGRALANVGIDRLRVEGHTDDIGSDAYNDRLSMRRAQTVAQVLSEAGIAMDRITVRGFGRSRPLVTDASRSGRRENRRVAIVIPAPGT